MTTDRLLTQNAVCEMTSLSRSTIWRLRQDARFPEPVHISDGRIAWRVEDVRAWMASPELWRNRHAA